VKLGVEVEVEKGMVHLGVTIGGGIYGGLN